MTIAAKLAELVSGASARDIAIIDENHFYWVVEYKIAGVKGVAEVIKRF